MKITLLEGHALQSFLLAVGVREHLADVRSVRICQQGDEVKIKVNAGMWSSGLGHLDPESDLAAHRREIDAGRVRILTDPS